MELHQLRYAVEVARHGSFTAAADELHISQSGVSAQVAKLERELGVRLFTRGSRLVTTTSDGAVLLPHAEAALREVARVRVTADELAGVTRGEVRIGTVISCTIPGYLAAFAEFRSRHPGVDISASEANSEDLIALLAEGRLDVAVVAHATPLPPGLHAVTIIDEPVATGVEATHRWADYSSIPIEALTEEPVLTLPHGTGVRAALEHTCRSQGIQIVPAVEAHSPQTALALASQGAGVAVLSASMISDELRLVAIRDAAHACLSLAFRTDQGTAARAFITLLQRRLRPDSSPA